MASVKLSCLVAHDDNHSILQLHSLVRQGGLQGKLQTENMDDGILFKISAPEAEGDVGAPLVEVLKNIKQLVRLEYVRAGDWQAVLKVPLKTGLPLPEWVAQLIMADVAISIDVKWDDAIKEEWGEAGQQAMRSHQANQRGGTLPDYGGGKNLADPLRELGFDSEVFGFLKRHDITDLDTLLSKSEQDLRGLRILNPERMDGYIQNIIETLARRRLTLKIAAPRRKQRRQKQ